VCKVTPTHGFLVSLLVLLSSVHPRRAFEVGSACDVGSGDRALERLEAAVLARRRERSAQAAAAAERRMRLDQETGETVTGLGLGATDISGSAAGPAESAVAAEASSTPATTPETATAEEVHRYAWGSPGRSVSSFWVCCF
jgi:hypothetical protein